jgi:glycosyltransferase involved in cell wall biosynthesis
LHSLSRAYQRHLGGIRYEVIVADNGSADPLPESLFRQLGEEFRYHRVQDATHSPARGINEAAAMARGRLVGVMIDGARILTPGVLHRAVQAFRLVERPVVYTLGWHLGAQCQAEAIGTGYNQDAEDALLRGINWPSDGYRLFEISTQAGNSNGGWLLPPGESNCLFVRREDFQKLGGYDAAFDQPGGGTVNHDFFHRALALPDAVPIVLFGEGSFHQIHGGTTTAADPAILAKRLASFWSHYEQLRGEPLVRPVFTPLLLGQLPPSAARFLRHSVNVLNPA